MVALPLVADGSAPASLMVAFPSVTDGCAPASLMALDIFSWIFLTINDRREWSHQRPAGAEPYSRKKVTTPDTSLAE